ncbi:hypothetical protein [Agathobaculum butyriciproducens]|uniref:hypothetical protein n=1 Tax=Agathobaculum butyriciproducens TaxID=1628085 RepID=UPI0036D39813
MTAWDARFLETDAEGNKKTYTYDALGRTKTETDGAGNKTTYTYGPGCQSACHNGRKRQ